MAELKLSLLDPVSGNFSKCDKKNNGADLLASQVMSILPYFLSFAAGAMLFVVVEELVPEMAEGEHSNLGTIMFMLGFVLMMILDVALG